MKRTLALILSLVMCLGLLAGCGDKKDNQTKDENTPRSTKSSPPSSRKPSMTRMSGS